MMKVYQTNKVFGYIQETDEFFERQKQFLLTYNTKIKDATAAADKATRAQKSNSLFFY